MPTAKHLSLALSLIALSCAPARTPAPSTAPPADVPPPAASASAEIQPGEPSATAVQVSVRDGAVFVQGEQVGVTFPGEGKVVPGLLERMRGLSPSEHDGTYRLSVSGDLDAAQFKSVAQTIAYADWPIALVDTDAGEVSLVTPIVASPNSQPRARGLPPEVLTLIVRRGNVEVWRVPVVTGDGQPTAVTRRLDDRRPLERVLSGECQRIPCNPAIVRAENGVTYQALRRAFAALADVSTSTPVEVHLRFNQPGPPGTPPPSTTTTASRLPPEVIQSVVRTKYAELRSCYESGLKQDPKLAGKLVVRFIINRDGTVSDVTPTDGTTLTDKPVQDCMVAVYEKLVFPSPEGGIVTVVYPLQFSPD